MADVRRLNWGSGSVVAAGWENSDVADHGQQHVGDILNGLPYPDDHFDYVVANHSLNCLEHRRVGAALAELRRVTRPGGRCRVLVPDVVRAFREFENHNEDHFPNRRGSLDRRFSMYLTWCSENRSAFTREHLRELMVDAGWRGVTPQEFGITDDPDPECAALDSRSGESVIVEAIKPRDGLRRAHQARECT